MKDLLLQRFYIFWLTAVPVFVAVLLLYAGLDFQSLIRSRIFPQVPATGEKQPKDNTSEKIKTALNQTANTYVLVKSGENSKPWKPSWFDKVSSFIVLDYETGEVLAQKDLEKRVPIASLTKLMTAVVALDLASPVEEFIAPSDIQSIRATHIAITPGEKIQLENLIDAILVTSANDAAQVIKYGVDEKYGKPVFVQAMNEKAKMLGLYNTNLITPQGFDNPDHYSSAEDLAVLTHYAMENYPLIKRAVKKESFAFSENTAHRGYNWNGLLGVYPGVMGVKIGNTRAAGTTNIILSEREGKKLLVVMLGAPNVLERDLWTAELLDVSFKNVAKLPEVAISETMLRAKYRTWQNLN